MSKYPNKLGLRLGRCSWSTQSRSLDGQQVWRGGWAPHSSRPTSGLGSPCQGSGAQSALWPTFCLSCLWAEPSTSLALVLVALKARGGTVYTSLVGVGRVGKGERFAVAPNVPFPSPCTSPSSFSKKGDVWEDYLSCIFFKV